MRKEIEGAVAIMFLNRYCDSLLDLSINLDHSHPILQLGEVYQCHLSQLLLINLLA